MKKKVALVLGDGSGPEMMAQAIKIVEHAARLSDVEIEWVKTPMGWCAYKEYGDASGSQRANQLCNIGPVADSTRYGTPVASPSRPSSWRIGDPPGAGCHAAPGVIGDGHDAPSATCKAIATPMAAR